MNSSPSTEAKSEVYAMIRKLGSMRAKVRAEAEQSLKHLTDDQVVALVQISGAAIEARLEEQRLTGTLLRASQSDTIATELVRAAAESNQHADAVLLRPSKEKDVT